ncbi:MAG TPA: YdeI/OmpD-associated family protein [Acidobacteriota bacterium]|nr:YdeI/OmpD-associated family protein [Acidobacteriota bacterium]
MSKPKIELQQIYIQNRQEWRDWLAHNGSTSPGIWLVYYKAGTGKPSIKYTDAVKEALCFGWIDSKAKTIDAERYMQIFTPRKTKSVWSKLNKSYIKELIELGLMAEAGLQKIEMAKADGSWTSLDAIEELVVPPDLQSALETSEAASSYFEQASNSTKKSLLFWVESAKRPETRAKRIAQLVESAAQNKHPVDQNSPLVSNSRLSSRQGKTTHST